jgi:hypothetical protein
MSDPATLRKRIAELEGENRDLKSKTDSGQKGLSSTMSSRGQGSSQPSKDWMNFGGAPLERPTTAQGGSTQQMKDLQEELKFEKKDKKKLLD